MTSGLSIRKNGHADVALDADNLFWAVTQNHNKYTAFVPGDILALYEKVKDKLTDEVKNFRFSQELTAIYIDPTDKCNASCPYCYIPNRIKRRGRSMTKGELKFILEKIRRHFKDRRRRQVIIFHASEPLMVKQMIFEAIVEYNSIFKFGLQTNGILLEKEDVEFLKKYRVGVGISLDSYSPFVNNRLRPSIDSSDSFSRAINAIECFNGYKGLNVITTATKLNVKDLPGIIKFLHTKKVPCVLINPVRLTQPSARALKPDEETLTKYFIKAVDTAVELSSNTKQKIVVGNFANTILAIIAPVARRLMCDISPCGAGRCFFTITAKGDIIPCGEFIGLKGFSGGNIFDTSISRAMKSKAFSRVRSRIVEKIDECKICDFRNICGAPCPAELQSFGNMHQKSIFCNFYKAVAEHAFKLISEGKIKHIFREESSQNLEYEYDLKEGR